MKKSLYLKLSQQEANRKIQMSLAEKHKRIKKKNCLLGFLYFIVAYILYSSVAIISFMYRWFMISRDFRFTPHYLQTVIDYNGMGTEQANQYLDTQWNAYKKSRSYGNFTLAERDTINTTFDILFEKYKLPEPKDNKHQAVMSELSKIENISLENNQGLTNLTGKISDLKSTIEPITSYTIKKRQKEDAEEERIIELKVSQEKRSVSAYNRAKGKKLSSFESALTDKQIVILVEYCNKIAVFDRDIEFLDMKQILLCIHQKPLKLSVNKYLALLFSELSDNKLICKIWKSVACNYNCFVSSEDKTLTSNDLYMANQTSGLIDPDKYDLITECVEKIQELRHKQ
ncbi:MAG: hypothetical protein ACK5KT_13885 [Dysgonomonas sp.]